MTIQVIKTKPLFRNYVIQFQQNIQVHRNIFVQRYRIRGEMIISLQACTGNAPLGHQRSSFSPASVGPHHQFACMLLRAGDVIFFPIERRRLPVAASLL